MKKKKSNLKNNYRSLLRDSLAIVNGKRKSNYGNFKESFSKISKVLELIFNIKLPEADLMKVFIITKLVREGYYHQRDNLLDSAGYTEFWDYFENNKKR